MNKGALICLVENPGSNLQELSGCSLYAAKKANARGESASLKITEAWEFISPFTNAGFLWSVMSLNPARTAQENPNQ